MSKKSNKPKKEKPIYIDDGSTIADMSALPGGRRKGAGEYPRPTPKKGGKWREYTATYFAAVRMMILPMFVTIGILSVAFLILWLIAR